ncbi:MAG: hypothetical protein NC397_02995 [Clostridium sp.]|nr:hypothetical protein [Clostridium sp.]
MKEFRKKQRRLYKIMKFIVIFGAVFIFVYIGAAPYVLDASQLAASICQYVCDIMVIAILVILFSYYSKYGKCDSFLNYAEHEISDAGYYLTSRSENDINAYSEVMYKDLSDCGYAMSKNIEINDFDFFARAMKKKEFFYIAAVDNADKNDVLAYLDSVINDITVKNLKRKGSGVLCIITDEAEDDAVALSKMITPLGKKEQLKIAIAICEMNTGRVYFLGNMNTKCQQLIANFAMNCDVPIKEQYIGKEKLQFQYDLELHMEDFNIKDFKNGSFYSH